MSSITVSNLGKAYKQYPTRWSRLLEWLFPAFGVRHTLKWVLQDIDFHIAAGESVGLIGVNGAGKSTLLKLITGTTTPSTGGIQIQGRVAALLELGIGFHPDFTGRQNVMISGQLLGLTPEQITALMPEILAFAEIGDYIDEQVRVYSSGMQMRLAFSVATCVRPDILIVDEALAVGDVFFQQRCFERITNYIKAGTTLLFVSHSAGTVLNICHRCIFLRHGKVAFDGTPMEALDLYQADLLTRLDQAPDQMRTQSTRMSDPSAAEMMSREIVTGTTGSIVTAAADCIGVRLLDGEGETRAAILGDETVTLQIDYRFHEAASDPHVGFKIRNRFGVVLFETNSFCMKKTIGPVSADSILSVNFVIPMHLFPNEYTVTVGLADGGYGEGLFERQLSYLHEVSTFVVLPNPASILWGGQVNLLPRLEFKKI